MDVLVQTKLSREEWNSIEKPLPANEKRILELIRDGYSNVNLRINHTKTMFSFTKLQHTEEIEFYLYDQYFSPLIKRMVQKYGKTPELSKLSTFSVTSKKIKKLKSIEALRIKNSDTMIQTEKQNIYEFILLDYAEKICQSLAKRDKKHVHELYTLIQWRKNSIVAIQEVQRFVDLVVEIAKQTTNVMSVISQAALLIEENPSLIQNEDMQLFKHQKDLFTLCKNPSNKLVLYIAPTGTGKTLSPLGLSNQYKILFVCVARHIGLALARSAICIEKKVAFAFGCNTADDIRLHYYAATNYTINKRSGGIGRVDNSKGENVEIMICDVQSYVCAMHYMMAFNDPSQLMTYWDEPTISMDYNEHPLHDTIHRNWCENQIPNVVLSCATLPKEHEIQDVLQDFRVHFEGASVHTITSYDCKKSIPIIGKEGYCYLPHTHCETHDKLHSIAAFCEDNKTLLRYFDLKEIIKFIGYLHVFKGTVMTDDSDDSESDSESESVSPPLENQPLTRLQSIHPSQEKPVIPDRYKMVNYFTDIAEITMDSIKVYYLTLLQHIEPSHWPRLYKGIKSMQTKRFPTKTTLQIQRSYSTQGDLSGQSTMVRQQSDSELSRIRIEQLHGILLTTADAHTLTDGPTIYLADNVSELAKFYIEHSDISEALLESIRKKIEKNQMLSEKIAIMEKTFDEKMKKADNTDKNQEPTKKGGGKVRLKQTMDETTEALQDNMNNLLSQIEMVQLENDYIPNTIEHQEKWSPEYNKRGFIPRLNTNVVKEIMALPIESSFKILTLMGVGVLVKQENTDYEEIVKRLAQEQKLFIILTTSDYIYGTNYQFCHGFIGNDLENMTPQKTLQSMGRIGRNHIQQDYTIRFRNNAAISRLFETPEHNLEADNMNRLFCRE